MQDDTAPSPPSATRPVPRVLEHIAAIVDEMPSYAAVDTRVWVATIDAWASPLPAARAWRRQNVRRRLTAVGNIAPAVVRSFTPPAGTVPQPRCSRWCAAEHAYDEEVSA